MVWCTCMFSFSEFCILIVGKLREGREIVYVGSGNFAVVLLVNLREGSVRQWFLSSSFLHSRNIRTCSCLKFTPEQLLHISDVCA